MAKTDFKKGNPKAKSTVEPPVSQEERDTSKKKKFNAREMIIYSEIMKPKF